MSNQRNYVPFHGVKNDQSFLVAKGKFIVPAQNELKRILDDCRFLIQEKGMMLHHPQIKDLKARATEIEKKILVEQREAEDLHVKKLSKAVYMAIKDQGNAVVRAIGREANYNAQKAIGRAKDICKNKNIDIWMQVGCDTGNIGALQEEGHCKNVTAYVWSVLRTDKLLEKYKENGNG